MRNSIALIGIGVPLLLAVPAVAGEVVYTPMNPSFGGSTLNFQYLMGLATAQNSFKGETAAGAARAPLTASERFAQQLQSRLYAGLAQQVSESIFGENAQPSGHFVFDDQQIDFVNDGQQVTITILNTATGETTEISVPTM